MGAVKKLKRDLKLIDIFSIATGAMISSGLFVLPGLAHASAGPAVILSYFIAAFLAMPGMFSQAELVSAMPKAGGTYFYITRSLGPAAGTIGGIVDWLTITLKSSFALVGMAAFATMVAPVNLKVISVIFALVFIFLNFTGAKSAGRTQTMLVAGLLGLLTFFIARGLGSVSLINFSDFTPGGMSAVISTAGFVFISYGGILKVASIAEEAENPAVNIPRGMIFSLVLVSIFYILVVFVTTGVLSSSVLDNSLTPITDAASVFMGEPGRIALAVAAMLAFISTANAGIMSASRYPLALSRDRMLPKMLKKLNSRNVPVNSLLLTGIIVIISLFLNLTVLVKAASTVMILSFMFACFSVIVLRESHVQNYQPAFKAPFYPWSQILGIVALFSLLFKMGLPALVTTLFFFFGGFLIYWSYGRKRAQQEFALIHLIERIGDKKLTGGLLESELKSIIRERDDIVRDRFDHLIENCDILDYDNKIGMNEFFTEASRRLGKKLDMPPGRLHANFMKREKETSTVLSSFLAIPHIVIEGENIFEILVARSREGIEFETPEGPEMVNAVFVLVGSQDERNFHLKTLSAISQLVQNPTFTEKWMTTKSKTNIRDIILLGERTRHETSS